MTIYERRDARQFAFDLPRQRWMTREVDPNTFASFQLDDPNGAKAASAPQVWIDQYSEVPWSDHDMAIVNNAYPVTYPREKRRFLGRWAPTAMWDDSPDSWPAGLDVYPGSPALLPVLAGEQNMDPSDPNLVLPGAAGTRYYHMDLTGSVIMTTGPDGTGGEGDVSPVTLGYTAFGELVVWDPDAGDGGAWIIGGPLGDGSAGAPPGYPRYQYCGTWGYESGRDPIEGASGPAADPDLLTLAGANPTLPKIKLMHVGARWYDPAIARFVQRDPIGISGGLNAYSY